MFQLQPDTLLNFELVFFTLCNTGAVVSHSILKCILRITSQIKSPPLPSGQNLSKRDFISWMERLPRCFAYHSSCENCALLRDYSASSDYSLPTIGSVSSPLCVCEYWKGYVVKHNYVN